MINFCTLFDSVYLSRGLLLYNSIKNQNIDFHLFIVAFDDLCYSILSDLELERSTIISLNEFESQELLNIKGTRTKAEYCWTSTPSVIYYVIVKYQLESCTYLDSDLYFYDSPLPIFNEIEEEKNILITEHRYSWLAKIIDEKRAGRFCVQFITFSKSVDSISVLDNWKNQCIDWCYARYEDGKFGDQKYLDEWPDKYKNVHILKNLGGGVAPWNINQYKVEKVDCKMVGKERKSNISFRIIFYHFHFVRFLKNGSVDLGWDKIPKKAVDLLYIPYIKSILEIENKLEKDYKEYKRSYFNNSSGNLRSVMKNIFKEITNYNIINTRDI